MHAIHHPWGPRRPLVRDAVLLAVAFVLGYRAKSALDGTARIASRYAAIRPERDDRTPSIVFTRGYFEPLDCVRLLRSYRTGTAPQLQTHTDAYPLHKSYARLTATKVPFYVTTNDGKIDRMRVGLFESGEYYETAMTSVFQSILEEEWRKPHRGGRRKRPIVLDVGANIGWFTLLAAAHGAEVYSFEPNVANMIRLCESLVLNGWADRVHPFLEGVSDKHGATQQMFKVDPSNPGSFSFSKETAEKAGVGVLEGDPLQLVSLDALAEDQRWLQTAEGAEGNHAPISILKIDTEGLELKVLQGAKMLLKSGRVENIFMELKDAEGEVLWAQMFDILFASGYTLYKVGDHRGPTEAVASKHRTGKEAASEIAVLGYQNANIWSAKPSRPPIMDVSSRKRPAASGSDGGDSALYRSLLSIVAKSLAASHQTVADGAPATIRESYGDMTSLFTSGEDGGGVSSLVDLLLGKLDSVHDRFSPESASAPSKLEELLQKQDILPVLQKIEAAVAAVEKEERDFAAAEEADRQSAKEAIKLAKSTKVEPDGKKRRVMPAESIGYHAHKLKAEYQASLAKELEEVQRENAKLEGELKEKWGEWEAGLAGVKGALASMETLGGGGD